MKVFGLHTNYFESGTGDVILFLHGWGSDVTDFLGTAKLFSKSYHTVCLDLWGFGKSEEPKLVWGINEYAKALQEFVRKLKIKSFHLVGHSFGGKLAIKFASENLGVKSLVLVDSAGMKQKFSLLRYLKIKRYQRLKKKVEAKKLDENVLKKFGSTDFKQSSGIMKKILTKVVNQNVENESKKVGVKTLILWGKFDKDTPLYMAKKLNKNIFDSKLVVLNGGHFSHIDCYNEFNKHLEKFWRGL